MVEDRHEMLDEPDKNKATLEQGKPDDVEPKDDKDE